MLVGEHLLAYRELPVRIGEEPYFGNGVSTPSSVIKCRIEQNRKCVLHLSAGLPGSYQGEGHRIKRWTTFTPDPINFFQNIPHTASEILNRRVAPARLPVDGCYMHYFFHAVRAGQHSRIGDEDRSSYYCPGTPDLGPERVANKVRLDLTPGAPTRTVVPDHS